MPAVTPNSRVMLLSNVPLAPDYQDTLDFSNATAQYNYFISFLFKSYDDFTYQRANFSIRVPDVYDNVINCNYVMYQNTQYGNKWFYAFVTDCKYINAGMTEITIELDVMQSWLFDYTLMNCFILREHTATDNIYEHNYPEGLELGPYEIEKDNEYLITEWSIVLEFAPSTSQTGYLKDNVYTATVRLHFDATETGVGQLNQYINQMSEQGRLNEVVRVYMVPSTFFSDSNTSLPVHSFTLSNSTICSTTYKPKNKKLFSYPYRYILGDNQQGTANIYRPELFGYNKSQSPLTISFSMRYSELTPQIVAIPWNYAVNGLNFTESITMNRFPTSAWNGDAFQNELAQNRYELAYRYVSEGLNVVANAAIGNIGGTFSAASAIIGDMAQLADRSLYPYQIQGQQTNSDVMVKMGEFGYKFYVMSITEEYAQIIDDFFTHYGYKVNRFDVPNTKSRPYWNYLETKRCRIKGDIPEIYIRKIEEIYNNGVTIWHGGNVGNYSRDNSPA